MKVLVLPHNFGSMPSITIDALRKKGVDARGLTFSTHKYQYLSSFMTHVPFIYHDKNPLKVPSYLWVLYKHYRTLDAMLEWCDVVHWVSHFYLPFNLDYKLLLKHDKPGLVEFVGSDIRNPEILKKINPYYEEVYNSGRWEYAKLETLENSNHVQAKFNALGYTPAVCPEMSLFVNRSIFSRGYYSLFQRLNIDDYQASYPLESNHKPVVLHSPSAKHTKGTYFIERAIEELKTEYDFEYRTLHNMPRAEVLAQTQSCDVFIDQIIAGSYGSATIEAMSMGKPVVVFLMPELFDNGLPKDIPAVNANPDTIKEVLKQLLSNGTLRNEVGKSSRKFVERYHNADLIADDLIAKYQDLINQHKHA
jgi:glycosyltransferase involved in cell wall biosynthesis